MKLDGVSKLLGFITDREIEGLSETLRRELEVFHRFINEAIEGERDDFRLYIERSRVVGKAKRSASGVGLSFCIDGIDMGTTAAVNRKAGFRDVYELWTKLDYEVKKRKEEIKATREEMDMESLEFFKRCLIEMHEGRSLGFQIHVCGDVILTDVTERREGFTGFRGEFNGVDFGLQAIHDALMEEPEWHVALYNSLKISSKLERKKNEKLSKDSERQAELDQGLRYNGGKNRLDLIPCSLIDGVGRVLTFGAQKYAPDNWRKFNQQQVKECIGSAMRHIEQYRQGNWLDPESGLPHLAHAATNLGFILELHKED